MAILVTDPYVEEKLKAEREASGADRFDEVWDGVYVMPPLANNEHQDLGFDMAVIFHSIIAGIAGARVYNTVNVSDRVEGWKDNYRIPDIAVMLPGGRAKNCGTHWCGGPDFITEILSADDRSRQKMPFYAQIGVRELLLVDRDPWQLELYRLQSNDLVLIGMSNLAAPVMLNSSVIPFNFRLVAGQSRPLIEIVETQSGQRWLV
jgi:Uma2 family endonuclease